jgi:hypothetical protein
MHADPAVTGSHAPPSPNPELFSEETNPDEEQGLIRHSPSSSSQSGSRRPPLADGGEQDASSGAVRDETELETRPGSLIDKAESGNFVKRKTSQLLGAIKSSMSSKQDAPLPPKLAELVHAYADSQIAASIQEEIRSFSAQAGANGDLVLPDIASDGSPLRSRQRASYATQFRILSGRAFKNLYRNPVLLTAHYCSSIAIART